MRCKIQRVQISEIDVENKIFRITTQSNIKALVNSIDNAGIINPPILIEAHNKFIVVSGFGRIKACGRLGWTAIEARILDAGPETIECARIAIADNASQRPLNLIEQSRSINLLSRFIDDPGYLLQELGNLGLPQNPAIVDKIKNICHFSQAVQNGILSGTIPMTVALELNSFHREAENRLAAIFNDLKISLNKQKQIITLLKEIGLRENITIIDIIEDDVQNYLNNKNMDSNQKTKKIRQYLNKRRFPEITRAEEVLEERLKKIKLGNRAKLIPPKNFEGAVYTLNLLFQNFEELENHQKTFNSILKNPFLKKILGRP